MLVPTVVRADKRRTFSYSCLAKCQLYLIVPTTLSHLYFTQFCGSTIVTFHFQQYINCWFNKNVIFNKYLRRKDQCAAENP